MRRRMSGLVFSLLVLTLAAPARAQSFPADRDWIAFPCGKGPMVDAVRDQPGAVDERDVVGDASAPAGFHAVDGQFLYLRLRVDADPLAGGKLRPFAWGFAFSTDAVATSYELLVTVDGNAELVALYRNGATTLPNSPADPADAPAVVTYPCATHGRVLAASSSFGGTGDSFIDMAVPWASLAPLGLSADTPIVVWAGSSANPDRLDADLACHDASRSGGPPTLDGAASGSTTASSTTQPSAGAGGSGGGPGSGGSGAGGLSLEGGPGCAIARTRAASAGTGLPLIALLIAAAGMSADGWGGRPRRKRRAGDAGG